MPNPTETPFAGIPSAAADGTLASSALPSARFPLAVASETLASFAHAAAAIARLDQALVAHPLTPAFLHRARLDAVRRQAAVDGQSIDPWQLAAILEGLRLRMDSSLRIIDRGIIFEAARHALHQYQWLTAPDFDQEGDIKRAEAALVAAPGTTPLLAAAHATHAWLGGTSHGEGNGHGGERAPMRAALIRHWTRHRLLRIPVPLTGSAALRSDTPWAEKAWVPEFLTALAGEADDALQLLMDLERAWFAARRAVAGRRRHSSAPAAIDLMAAAPLVSATSLAAGLDMAVKNASQLLDQFCAAGLAVEVTHRSKRRLYGLAGLAPLRAAVAPPYRPLPGRGRGRPPNMSIEDDGLPPPLPEPPLTPLERRDFDTTGLEAAMAFADATLRHARRSLDHLALGRSTPPAAAPPADHAACVPAGTPGSVKEAPPDLWPDPRANDKL